MKRLALTLAALLAAVAAHADNVKVLASNGVKAALEELAPQFERASGHKVTLKFGLAAVLKREIEAGEPFDLAILTAANIEDLIKQGKIDPATQMAIARSGIGIGIRAGAPKPDIGTPEALKRTLLAAKSVTWSKEGASGTYFANVVLPKMGIADQVMPKYTFSKDSTQIGENINAGKAELCALLVNEIMAQKGVEVAGPLPPELQSYLLFHGGVSSASKSSVAAKTLDRFFTTPAAGTVFRAKGQEPG